VSRRVIAGVVVTMLALGAGAGYAATQSTASGPTNVCVNDTNGLMRVATTCHDAEHPLTIDGGGSSQVTQGGTFSVPWGETAGGKVLPLTGVTLSGRCEVFSAPFGDGQGANARLLVDAPRGRRWISSPLTSTPARKLSHRGFCLRAPASSLVWSRAP
jgi:hypothetical protein